MSHEDIKKNIEKLMERAQEQAIGAKLLLARAEQLDQIGRASCRERV